MINNSNFFFAIRFTDYFGLFIEDPRFLTPKFKYEYYEINESTGELDLLKSEILEIGKCNTTHIDNYTLHKEN